MRATAWKQYLPFQQQLRYHVPEHLAMFRMVTAMLTPSSGRNSKHTPHMKRMNMPHLCVPCEKRKHEVLSILRQPLAWASMQVQLALQHLLENARLSWSPKRDLHGD